MQEDYEAFARQAKLMTSIHASIPREMRAAVAEARRRGDDSTSDIPEEKKGRPEVPRAAASSTSVVMKRRPHPLRSVQSAPASTDHAESEDEDDDPASASKENDPSLSPSPVSPIPTSPRRHVLGKRPLSDLPPPLDPDLEAEGNDDAGSPSEQNITNNISRTPQPPSQSSGAPMRKSPKLMELVKGVNASGRIRDDDAQIYEDSNTGEGKENMGSGGQEKATPIEKKAVAGSTPNGTGTPKPASVRKASAPGTGKGKARVGLRRL